MMAVDTVQSTEQAMVQVRHNMEWIRIVRLDAMEVFGYLQSNLS